MWKVPNKEVDLGEPTSFLDHVYLGCTQRQCETNKDIVDNYRTMFESRISAGRVEKLPFPQNPRISSWSYVMEGHAKKCVERYCELANKTTQQLHKVSTPCIDDHHFKEEELKSVGELSKVSSQIVLKCLYLARIGRPDILQSVNKLARSITKWTKACDKRLNHSISYIHHTCEYNQHCYVGMLRCSATMPRCLAPLLRYQAVWSPPVFAACVCDLCRVRMLVRLSHPRPPDRSQHGCTVGVLPGPTRVLPMPQAVWHRSQSANSCCAELCCVVVSGGASSTSSCGFVSSLRFVLCPLAPLLDMVTAVALSILRGTSHHSWLIALADTTDLRL